LSGNSNGSFEWSIVSSCRCGTSHSTYMSTLCTYDIKRDMQFRKTLFCSRQSAKQSQRHNLSRVVDVLNSQVTLDSSTSFASQYFRRSIMSPSATMKPSTATPAAGKFYADEGSVSSGSSESSSDSSDDGRGDENEETDMTSYARHSVTTGNKNKDEEGVKIRQKAFELINKVGGPSDEDRNNQQWPQSPKKLYYPPPQKNLSSLQSAGEHSAAQSYQSPYQQSSVGQIRHFHSDTSRQQSALEAQKLSVTGLFINCVSDLCQQSSKEILQQGASILSSGYQSVSQYRDTPLQGSYDPIDTSQHGYGNGNNKDARMRGRYQD
jgi:hypothetical protein